MGIEVDSDWRDIKHECAPSVILGTFTGSLVGLIEQLGQEHLTLLAKTVANLFPASVFSPDYKVPDKFIAATPALRKKTSSIRGTAGLRRKHLLKELSKAKTKSKTRLTYMDRPAPRPEPGRTRPRPDAH